MTRRGLGLGMSFATTVLAVAPAWAQVETVTFGTTAAHVRFLGGTAISARLRSQVGIDQVEEPYENLHKQRINIRAKKDEAPNLKELVALLEGEIGFAPMTELRLEGKGRVLHRGGDLVLEIGGGPTLIVQSVDAPRGTPPENEELAVVAVLADPRSPEGVVLREGNRPQSRDPGRRPGRDR